MNAHLVPVSCTRTQSPAFWCV